MFKDLPKEVFEVETVEINQNKLNIDKKYFKDYDIILIQSTTATGKTKDVATKSKYIVKTDDEVCEMDKQEYLTLLSIVNLISLALEQIDTFYNQSKITMMNYQKINFSKFENDNLVICINSLYKILNLDDKYFNNVVLYIDEINNLHETLTHNNTLDKQLNIIYTCLIKLIKNCKKIILTDAKISKNVFNLLSSRKKNNKTIFIKNTHKKYKDVKAIKYNDKNLFYEQLKTNIRNKDYFLFGCDVCAIITTMYNDLINEFPEQKESFILITSETNFRIKNATNQFKGKYVFYSPSITTGVNFCYEDKKQTQFIYLTGESVNPDGAFQMSSRTRNIKDLKYYVEDIKPQQMKYKSLEDVETKYKRMIEINDKLLRLSQSINKNDDFEIVENSFFKCFCYNEYIDNIFKTGYLTHYENILRNNGFILESVGEKQDFDLSIKRKHTELRQEIRENQIEEFALLYCEDAEGYKEIKLNVGLNEELYLRRTEILGLTTYDEENKKSILKYDNVKNYSVFLQDDKALNNLFNFQKLIRTDEYAENKIKEIIKNVPKTKLLKTNYTKLQYIKLFEKTFKLNRFDFETITITENLTEETVEIIEELFRIKCKLNGKEEILQTYNKLITNFCGDLPLIINERKGKARKRVYQLDKVVFKELIDLCQIKDKYLTNYNIDLIKKYYPEIIIPEYINNNNKDLDNGLDAEDEYENYNFSKRGKQ